jgi:hypothetical protein
LNSSQPLEEIPGGAAARSDEWFWKKLMYMNEVISQLYVMRGL